MYLCLIENSHCVENDNFLSKWDGKYVRISSLAGLINRHFGIWHFDASFLGNSLTLRGNAYLYVFYVHLNPCVGLVTRKRAS